MVHIKVYLLHIIKLLLNKIHKDELPKHKLPKKRKVTKSFGGDSYETIQPIQTWKNDDDYMIIGSCLY